LPLFYLLIPPSLGQTPAAWELADEKLFGLHLRKTGCILHSRAHLTLAVRPPKSPNGMAAGVWPLRTGKKEFKAPPG
jgi:hypothetical protein